MVITHKEATKTFLLGHYLDWADNISASKLNKSLIGKIIISTLQPIVKIIENIIIATDTEYLDYVKHLPQILRKFILLSAFYANLVSPNNIHRDKKDAKWCFIFPFGSCTRTGLHLPYCNAYITMNVTDLIMLNSRNIWHAAEQYTPPRKTRFSGILTAHSGLINKFIP